MMKKLFFLWVFVAMGFVVSAQTDFRDLSLKEALKVAKQEGKMVFVDFYTDWCGPCKKMARDVFPQKKVGDFFNAKFVCLKLNAEKEGKTWAQRYKVTAYPTFLVLDTDGEVQASMKGALGADEFMNKIEEQLNPDYAPERLTALYAEGNRTPEVVNRYAMYLLVHNQEKPGMKVVNDYYASLTEAARLKTENAFLFTRYTMKLDDEKAEFMVAHRKDFDGAVQKEIEEKIQQLYHTELTSYFSGYLWRNGEFKDERYQALKQQIRDLGLVEENRYEPVFRLIEGRVKSGDAEFLALCRKNFDELSDVGRNMLIMNMSRLVQTKDKAVLQDMAEFVRSRLNVLPPTVIVFAGRMLEDIESRAKD